jgi:hypothetical protein
MAKKSLLMIRVLKYGTHLGALLFIDFIIYEQHQFSAPQIDALGNPTGSLYL